MSDEIQADTAMIEETETIETASPTIVPDVSDVDASWDGKGSLDEHRQKALAALNQPRFGREGVKQDGQ